MTKEQLREVERDLVKIGLENVQNIVLIKNDATNGDVIKGLYSDTEVNDFGDFGKDAIVDIYGVDKGEYLTVRKDWWNALYERD